MADSMTRRQEQHGSCVPVPRSYGWRDRPQKAGATPERVGSAAQAVADRAADVGYRLASPGAEAAAGRG